MNITFAVLAGIGLVTYFFSKGLKPDDYETAHAREEVVLTEDETAGQQQQASTSSTSP